MVEIIPFKEVEPKPCPYCGGSSLTHIDQEDCDLEDVGFFVRCTKCNAQSPFLNSRNLAAEDWNALADLRKERDRLDALINNPHVDNFIDNIRSEAAHQRETWPGANDAAKQPSDWYWLCAYLGGKAIGGEDLGKRLHRIISMAAACLNWHRHESVRAAKAECDK